MYLALSQVPSPLTKLRGTTMRPKGSSEQNKIQNTTHLEKGARMNSLLPSRKTIAANIFPNASAT